MWRAVVAIALGVALTGMVVTRSDEIVTHMKEIEE